MCLWHGHIVALLLVTAGHPVVVMSRQVSALPVILELVKNDKQRSPLFFLLNVICFHTFLMRHDAIKTDDLTFFALCAAMIPLFSIIVCSFVATFKYSHLVTVCTITTTWYYRMFQHCFHADSVYKKWRKVRTDYFSGWINL